MNWAFFRVFGPYIAIVALVMVVLFIRGDKIKAEAETAAKEAEVTALRKVNEQNATSLKTLADASEDNARIAGEVAAKVDTIRVRSNTARTAVEEAMRNDPAIRDWGNEPVPSVVRDALKRR